MPSGIPALISFDCFYDMFRFSGVFVVMSGAPDFY